MIGIERHQVDSTQLYLAYGMRVSGDPRVEHEVLFRESQRVTYPEPGRLIPIGGAATVDNFGVIAEHLRDGKPAIVFTAATQLPEKRFSDTAEALSQVGAQEPFHLGMHTIPQEGDAMLRLGGGAFLTGGDQLSLVKNLQATGRDNDLRKLLADGYPIAGSSAGAAAQGRTMSYGGSVENGIGFVEEINITTHEWEMERDWRDHMMVDLTGTVSVGLPEGTGLIYEHNGNVETFGSNKVNLVWRAEGQRKNMRVPREWKGNLYSLPMQYPINQAA